MAGFYPIQVIPSRVWEHKISKRRASTGGSFPGSFDIGDGVDDWEIITIGYTVRNSNETTGCGRVPWKTVEEAEAYLKQFGRENHRLPTVKA